MAELSAVSGLSVATVKFYLRENLLAAGERTAPNQAHYGLEHVTRLRLIRSLIEVGGLTIADARVVLAAIDSDLPLQDTFAIAQRSVSEHIDPAGIDPSALDRVDAVLDGWLVSADNPGRLAAARVVQSLDEVGHTDACGWLGRYAHAAQLVAEADIDEIAALSDRAAQAQTVVVGTALGDALFRGLRRAAQEHVSALRYSADPARHHQTP
ncbi:MerR family transcriptional regulator [Cryobacterium sp. PH31-L1]|uniref:MerR family transcriptional regulator n=1 Tax=Cryobacterium sp. PH31-L1 TaxID=3046199 RepID=UPI0024BB2125|nr:MerR family transcriptional regulator [Cryobacterium sp. PH31-L1]MDJ0378858.1 MerR family transcriptional regulator [Cryobacterium sp. PH31-L1]